MVESWISSKKILWIKKRPKNIKNTYIFELNFVNEADIDNINKTTHKKH